MSGDVSKDWNFDHANDRVAMCAGLLFHIMLNQLAGDYHGTDVIASLQDLLWGGGYVDNDDPYDAFIVNLERSRWVLERLTAKERKSCSLNYFLMITCVDTNAGFLGGVMSKGGGTTYGNVFLGNAGDMPTLGIELLHHEQVHAQQWAWWGNSFGGLYSIESWFGFRSVCSNRFEIAAGLIDGGYEDECY
jgi:hypothetical protein